MLYASHLERRSNFFCGISFLGYGAACFLSDSLKREFDRYHFGPPRADWRIAVVRSARFAGWPERTVDGARGGGGLALMMLGAVGVRIKIKDTFLQTIPALFYLVLNAYLCLAAF